MELILLLKLAEDQPVLLHRHIEQLGKWTISKIVSVPSKNKKIIEIVVVASVYAFNFR